MRPAEPARPLVCLIAGTSDRGLPVFAKESVPGTDELQLIL